MKYLSTLVLLTLCGSAWGQEIIAAAPVIDKADTAFVIIASAMVLLMTPGLAFFYGGLSRNKSILNTMTMSFGAIGVVSIVWMLLGYTFAFGQNPYGSFFGSFDNALLSNIASDSLVDPEAGVNIPRLLFIMFQMTFAIIAVALISGSVVDRMKFSSFLIFAALWSVCVYSPIAHWVWDSSGFLFKDGAIDFAGGTVVHINAGVSGLVAAWVLGPRLKGTRQGAIPHNIPFVMLGAGLLWFGWFGFNAGSALSGNGSAAAVMLNTQLAAAAGLLTWLALEKARGHAMSAVGSATGAICGLVAITPACNAVSPIFALLVGVLGTIASFTTVQFKRKLPVDDALDVFACHGMAGIVGAIAAGLFAFSAGALPEGRTTLEQTWVQIEGVLYTIVYSAVGTYLIMRLLKATIGIRLEKDEEQQGIDIVCHEEQAYTNS